MAGTKDPNQGTIELEDEGPPSALGQIRLDGTTIKAQDGAGIFDLRTGAGIDTDKFLLTIPGTLIYIGNGDLLLTL